MSSMTGREYQKCNSIPGCIWTHCLKAYFKMLRNLEKKITCTSGCSMFAYKFLGFFYIFCEKGHIKCLFFPKKIVNKHSVRMYTRNFLQLFNNLNFVFFCFFFVTGLHGLESRNTTSRYSPKVSLSLLQFRCRLRVVEGRSGRIRSRFRVG
jgi:hypothetical protein